MENILRKLFTGFAKVLSIPPLIFLFLSYLYIVIISFLLIPFVILLDMFEYRMKPYRPENIIYELKRCIGCIIEEGKRYIKFIKEE